MIIRSLRLKNIKSYGEGPEGTGITVTFQPGVNHVAGRNGHGKTTLIEALGYGLFFAQPTFEETFKVPTYFLRAGEKEGEIDVVFEHAGFAYRIERGIGGKRKTKVVQLSDGSTCAEGDDGVSGWLCRLLASEKHRLIPLAHLFSNLVGVRQGHLSRPFDSTRSEAKIFFDPLLDVAIFRESTQMLFESQRRFKDLEQEQSLKLATIEECIRTREETNDKLPVKVAQLESLNRVLEKSRKQKEAADKVKNACELKQTAFNAAKSALDEASYQLKLATQKRENDQQHLKDSQDAASVVTKAEPAHLAFVQAEAQLRLLQIKQTQKTALLQQRAEALNVRTEADTRKAAAEKQAVECRTAHTEKTRHAAALREQLVNETGRLQQSQADFDQRAKSTSIAKRSRDAVESWLAALPRQVEQNKKMLTGIEKEAQLLSQWKPQALLKARSETERLNQLARELGHKLAKAEQAKSTLGGQLAQISGGMCPFLKETCRQFNSQAIQSDLEQREKEIIGVTRELKQATDAFERARKASEKLAQQEAQLDHLRKALEEKVRGLIDRHNQLFPTSVQEQWACVQKFAPAQLAALKALEEVAPDDCWRDFQSNFDPAVLAPLLDAETGLCGRVVAFEQASAHLDAMFDQFEQERENRVRQQQNLENSKKDLQSAENELKLLSQRIEQLSAEASQAAACANIKIAQISELDRKLEEFAHLDRDFQAQNESKDRNADDHKRYLGAKPVADKLEEQRTLFHKSSEAEARAQEAVRQKTNAFETASANFDAGALEKSRNEAAAAHAKVVMDEKAVQTAERELTEEKERFKQWKEACANRNKIHDEIGRLQAATHLSKLAGKVLKDAAPAVAQHLCSRIAAAAQRIFNQINPDPIELEWKAEPQYSLRISPGDRRFAMLSGGEQTKLALAMTLAMIEQFSGLRFAVFDEPTYGVDAESREKLADAIIDVQKAAGLNQLILVSHDNAFDGKLEHVVLLNKTAATGTQLAASV
jgi:DNA repair protein SbcC/Rad50